MVKHPNSRSNTQTQISKRRCDNLKLFAINFSLHRHGVLYISGGDAAATRGDRNQRHSYNPRRRRHPPLLPLPLPPNIDLDFTFPATAAFPTNQTNDAAPLLPPILSPHMHTLVLENPTGISAQCGFRKTTTLTLHPKEGD